jgi:P-type Ca2+ transporter type 2C
VGLSVCTLVVLVYGLTRGHWLDGLLAGVTLAMATLPEELPVVLTIFLALGAWRISRKQVLTRRMPAIETLGAATVLCVDKTGTLTHNRMSVSRIHATGQTFDCAAAPQQVPPEAFRSLLKFAVLASRQDPFDPMEKAIRQYGEQQFGGAPSLYEDWSLVREYPLSPELLALSHVWRSPEGDSAIVAAKGAPEAIVGVAVQGVALALPVPGADWIFVAPLVLYGIGLLEADGLLIAVCHALTLTEVVLAVVLSEVIVRGFADVFGWCARVLG